MLRRVHFAFFQTLFFLQSGQTHFSQQRFEYNFHACVPANLSSRHQGVYKEHTELHPNRNITYYLVYRLHVNVVIGRLLLGGDLYEKDKLFFPPPLTS